MVRQCAWIAAALLLAAAGFASAQSEAMRWYRIAADDGGVLGYSTYEERARADGRDIVTTQQIVLQEGREPRLTITSEILQREDLQGRTYWFEASSESAGHRTRSTAHIDAGRARITRESPSGRWEGEVALPEGVRFDEGEGLLKSWDASAAPRVEFEHFNAGAMDLEHVVLEDEGQTPEGLRAILRTRIAHGALVDIERLLVDADGRVVEVATPMFGAMIRRRESDQASAESRHQPYRILGNVMTRSPYRIPDAAMAGHIRYQFHVADGFMFTPPATGEQRVSLQDGVVTIDVCATCGPGLEGAAGDLGGALMPTAWLQSDDRRLRQMAEPVSRLDLSDAGKMELLAQRARAVLERLDFAGHYSALDTLARRAGDCTEAAVLLAALGRAAGIPTRVVNGVVYSRANYHGASNVFLPHSWVVAYVDGSWKSFDAALERFDSTHIVFSIGDGDARSIAAAGQLASILRMDSLFEVRSGVGAGG